MPSFSVFTAVQGTQFLNSGETGHVGRDGTIMGMILADGQISNSHLRSVDVRIDGTVRLAGVGSPVIMQGTDMTLFVGRTGVVYCADIGAADAGPGIVLVTSETNGRGTIRLANAGEIVGNVMGVYAMTSDADDLVRIGNSGTILGDGDGLFAGGSGEFAVSNSGVIQGHRYGLSNNDLGNDFNARLVLSNTGVIGGDQAAIVAGGANDRVANAGRLEGEVRLGGGNDLFDTRFGTATALVLGGEGDDLFCGNAAMAEQFDGGSGKDVLDFRNQGAAIVALDEEFGNAGAALGDVYAGFEVIYGSRAGNDRLRGDGAANELYGFGGADALDGAQGADILDGGGGADRLTGGGGNDTFRISSIREGRDLIVDFGSTPSTNDDAIQIVVSGFGGGLVAGGALAASAFQSRADNRAQDANDRFIFRTTDKTLWFDADGSGTGAAVMVADLQANATLTSGDILLI